MPSTPMSLGQDGIPTYPMQIHKTWCDGRANSSQMRTHCSLVWPSTHSVFLKANGFVSSASCLWIAATLTPKLLTRWQLDFLCGWLPMLGVFPSKLRPPVLHMDTLEKMSASFAAHSIGATKASGDKEMDRLLWEATMDEVKAGFLSGPYSVQELPKGAMASPRFGLLQKSKLRPIDNFSASHQQHYRPQGQTSSGLH